METSISYGFLSCVKLIFTCSCSNQYQFSPFSARDDIPAHTEMKKPHKHTVHTLHFYWVCASNVLIYDIDKFLLCLGKIHFFKFMVLISTQLACKYSPAWNFSSLSSYLSFLICCWSKEWKLYFLIPLHGGELYTILHFFLVTKPENPMNSKWAWILSCWHHTVCRTGRAPAVAQIIGGFVDFGFKWLNIL